LPDTPKHIPQPEQPELNFPDTPLHIPRRRAPRLHRDARERRRSHRDEVYAIPILPDGEEYADLYGAPEMPQQRIYLDGHLPVVQEVVEHLPAGPDPRYRPDPVDEKYEERAWELFEGDQNQPARVRRAIRGNYHRNYFQYNHLNDEIEAQPRPGRVRIDEEGNEIRQLAPHPLEDRSRPDSQIPLESNSGRPATLGDKIDLRMHPRALHIHIKKGVQDLALRKLAERIVQHRGSSSATILQQKNKSGKDVFVEWINASEMSKLDAQKMYERLLKLTNARRKAATIVVKTAARGGAIHQLWNSSASLL